MSYPRVLDYRGVIVVPFASLLLHRLGRPRHQGGPIWPDWDREPLARYFRNSSPADTRPEPRAPRVEVDDEGCYWIGPIWPHFGHIVADYTTRTLPTVAANREATLVFGVVAGSGISSLQDAPSFFRDVLGWYGVPQDRVLVVDRPTRFRRLGVVAQPERSGTEPACAPDPDHIEALTALTRRRLGTMRRAGVLFVSRSGMRNRFAGESHLDQAFQAAGATVIHPERLCVAEQLRAYAGHETLIFSEGSAVHGLQLLGRNLGRVVVLRRRSDRRFGEVSVLPRAEGYVLLETSRAFVTGLEPDGAPNAYEGIAILDPDALLSGLLALGIDLRPHWRPDVLARVQAGDLRHWIRSRGRILVSRHPRSVFELLSGLRRSGVRGARELGAQLLLHATGTWVPRGLKARIGMRPGTRPT